MKTLGMNLKDVLVPVTKTNFNKWHNEGSLLLLNAGNGVLDIILSRLNDISIDWREQGRQVGVATTTGKQHRIYMFSNGVQEFVIVADDMTATEYSRNYFTETGKQHLTIYVVND